MDQYIQSTRGGPKGDGAFHWTEHKSGTISIKVSRLKFKLSQRRTSSCEHQITCEENFVLSADRQDGACVEHQLQSLSEA